MLVGVDALAEALAGARVCDPQCRARLAPREVDTNSDLLRYRAADLAKTDGSLAHLVIARHCSQRGLAFGRHGASLSFQRYAHKLCSIGVGASLSRSLLPELGLDNVTTQFIEHSPHEVLVGTPAVHVDPTPRTVVEVLVTNHLEPVARVWQQASGVSMRNLLGNLSASLALGVRRAVPLVGISAARAFGEAMVAARPELAGLGEYRVVTAGGKQGLFFDRRSCCHWYAARDGKLCSWCCRKSADERLDDYRAALLANEPAPPFDGLPSAGRGAKR